MVKIECDLKISLIICTYYRKKWVENLLISIKEQSFQPFEIFLVDASQENIEYNLPPGLDVNLIRSDKMQLTYQRNLGVDAATGNIILHIDDDTYLEQDYIQRILEVFMKDKENKIGVVSGYVTNQWGKTQYKPTCLIKMMKWFGIYDGNFSPGTVSPSGVFIELNGLLPFEGIKQTDFMSGCSFAVRSEVYKRYKHPEIINKYGGEDKTFSRIISNEWKIYVCGDAKLQHFSAGGGARQTDFSETMGTVKFMLFIQKNYGLLNRSTWRLRLHYILSALRMYFISIVFILSIIKTGKSAKWFLRATGYLVGALSSVEVNHV